MANGNVKVQVAGPLLSTVLYDMINGFHDLEGLIYGVSRRIQVTSLEDDPHARQHDRTVIVIHRFQILGPSFSFYDRAGSLNESRLKSSVAECNETLLGWFRFRRGMMFLRPTVRDEAIHENLAKFVSSNGNGAADNLLLGVFTMGADDSSSTHTYDFSFSHHDPAKGFQRLPLEVTNLGESAHSEYSNFIAATYYGSDGALGQVHGSLAKIKQSEVVGQYEDVCQAVLHTLGVCVDNLSQSEETLGALKREVEILRKRLEARDATAMEDDGEKAQGTSAATAASGGDSRPILIDLSE